MVDEREGPISNGLRDSIMAQINEAVGHLEEVQEMMTRDESSGLGIDNVIVSLQDIYNDIDDGRNKS